MIYYIFHQVGYMYRYSITVVVVDPDVAPSSERQRPLRLPPSSSVSATAELDAKSSAFALTPWCTRRMCLSLWSMRWKSRSVGGSSFWPCDDAVRARKRANDSCVEGAMGRASASLASEHPVESPAVEWLILQARVCHGTSFEFSTLPRGWRIPSYVLSEMLPAESRVLLEVDEGAHAAAGFSLVGA
ncbi:hypothetical protein PF002_g14550 [Phytophthora fragariae]|uniref:Uncharacterized protein n=1 Tax=Phytophthora fragariae TaxID=53985 RepID=A0A6A3YXE4_9STRA|nr:hypothetical protein PF002_g14550 [Phytophthora fragariae]